MKGVLVSMDTDTLEDTRLFDLELLEDAHCQVEHIKSQCTVTVVWSAPPSECGCYPRVLACQGAYDYVFDGNDAGFLCNRCKNLESSESCRTGWYKV